MRQPKRKQSKTSDPQGSHKGSVAKRPGAGASLPSPSARAADLPTDGPTDSPTGLAAEKALATALSRAVWPAERDVMMRPERLRYVRKMVKPKGCVFCACANAGAGFTRLVLYRGKRAMVVLNKYPYNNGHLLVIPTRHEGDFTALDEKELRDLHFLLRETVRIVRKSYACPGLNVGLNLGEAAGAGIPDHLHYHVIPRWRGDTNFFPLIAETKVVVETLEQTFERLLPFFQAVVLPGKRPA